MKKITTFILLFILIITVIKMRNIYKVNKDYIITNELGEEIPAQIIKKKNDSYFIIFSINELLPYSTLVISPKNKLIGIPNGGNRRFFNITNNYIYDKNSNDDSYKILYINGKEPYTNNNYPNQDPVIKNIVFLDDEINFNSYDKLNDYGKKIILKKR